MKGKKIAIFDFDGTIVSKNTGSEFYKWQARKSFWRVIALTLLLPILVPLRIIAFLTNDPHSQKLGLNIVCFVSTCFLKEPLFRLRQDFIHYYFSRGGAIVHQDALYRIKMHQQKGDHVIIISGCPHWILHHVARHIGITDVTLIGSEVSFSWKGLLLSRHCHQKNKVVMACDKGVELDQCGYGYSDSPTDIAILGYCKKIVLVNANSLKRAILRRQLQANISCETWK